MSELKYEVPEGGFRIGGIVMSKHHGRGVYQGGDMFVFDRLGGTTHYYSQDGRYFTRGAFEDKECMLALVERPLMQEEASGV